MNSGNSNIYLRFSRTARKSNVDLPNALYRVDYATITMFTMSKRKHCVYSFCTKISAFFSPTNRTK